MGNRKSKPAAFLLGRKIGVENFILDFQRNSWTSIGYSDTDLFLWNVIAFCKLLSFARDKLFRWLPLVLVLIGILPSAMFLVLCFS